MEYIIAFESTNFAIKGEACLTGKGVPAAVMPLPPQIRAGCGICLRVPPDYIGQAAELLKAVGITGYSLFTRTMEKTGYIYWEVEDGNKL